VLIKTAQHLNTQASAAQSSWKRDSKNSATCNLHRYLGLRRSLVDLFWRYKQTVLSSESGWWYKCWLAQL